MGANAARFDADLKRETKAFTATSFRHFRDKLLFDALSVIDETWPVLTGFSRASNLPFAHDPGAGLSVAPPEAGEGEADVSFGDGVTGEKLDMTQAVLRATDPFDTVGIANNVIYSPVLEKGHGKNPQSSHMYRRAMEAVKDVVETAEVLK